MSSTFSENYKKFPPDLSRSAFAPIVIESAKPHAELRHDGRKADASGRFDKYNFTGLTHTGIPVMLAVVESVCRKCFCERRPDRETKAELRKCGVAGGVAGIVIRASSKIVSCYFWLPWHNMSQSALLWEDERLIECGPTDGMIQFEQVFL